MIIQGNNMEALAKMADNSVDAVVTDPPYGMNKLDEKSIRAALVAWLGGEHFEAKGAGFMGKDWDSFVPGPELWEEIERVLKPGGHLLVFAASRTVDLMAISMRLAGLEIRDQLQWLYGSGFPKSANISKMIDKAAGAEREVVGNNPNHRPESGVHYQGTYSGGNTGAKVICAPATDLAKQWDGWGTALKPAHEPIIMARKPFKGTIANNVQEHGTGGINIDGCRVAGKLEGDPNRFAKTDGGSFNDVSKRAPVVRTEGRWPANVILDEEAGALLDDQSGNRPGMSGGGKHKTRKQTISGGGHDGNESHIHSDNGGASRFFYCPKASKKEREAGLEDFEPEIVNKHNPPGTAGSNSPRAGAGRTGARKNHHPTVKPVALMRYCLRLVTPPGGTVLDPFCGSGSTGIAAKHEGFDFIGLELDPDYVKIAEARIENACIEKESVKGSGV